MGADAVGVNQFIDFRVIIVDVHAVDDDFDAVIVVVNAGDAPDVAVKDVLFVIIFSLHHLVADAEGATAELLLHQPFFTVERML